MTLNPTRIQWNARLLDMRRELVSERRAYGSALDERERKALSEIIGALKDLAARVDK